MKKLIMAAMLCVAITSQGASVSWSAGKIFNGSNSTTGVGTGTAYLVLVSSLAQSDAVSYFAEGKTSTITGSAIGSSAISDSKVAYNTLKDVTAPTSASAFYYVVIVGDNMLVSTEATSSYDAVTTVHALEFASSKDYAKALPTQAFAGYSGAGWYNVPEPTSGLLLLLGVAGLALKRKRA